MSIEIKVPMFPESVSEGEIAAWHVAEGDVVNEGDILLEVETDKVVMEVPAIASGTISKCTKAEGDTVTSEEVVGELIAGEGKTSAPVAQPAAQAQTESKTTPTKTDKMAVGDAPVGPAARRVLSEHEINANDVPGTGKAGRVTKHDVTQFIASGARIEERVPMTRLRKTVAKRLLDVQHNNAILTTFNEVDMHAVKTLRAEFKDDFEKKHGTRLGFMSFFLKAATEALKLFPAVNASIDGDDMVYHGYYDISVAVSSPRGLVVPVVRDVDQLSMAQIEAKIRDYAVRAREGSLGIEDMQGGTFTITNGGTFGSMLSTPIINQPQSAILGMHNIVERPHVVDGEIKIRPIMYLALSYDHRIIDGKDSVSFLRTMKEFIENPARMLLGA